MAKGKVWMRMGDNDDYHDFDGPFSAGSELGSYLSEVGTEKFKAGDIRWRGKGLEIDGFTNYNYISLFWGDEDAQDSQELSKADKTQFVAGVRDGGYFFPKPSKPKSATVKPLKSRRKSSSPPTSLRGVRG